VPDLANLFTVRYPSDWGFQTLLFAMILSKGNVARCKFIFKGAIHQLLSIILKLTIHVLLLVSTLPNVVKVNNYSEIGE
jgi:hypothetical protein